MRRLVKNANWQPIGPPESQVKLAGALQNAAKWRVPASFSQKTRPTTASLLKIGVCGELADFHNHHRANVLR